MAGKTDLVEHLAGTLPGVSKKVCGEAVDAIFEYISAELAKGERIQVPGFGTFQVSMRKSRQGLNPRSREPIQIPASNSVRFKPGRALRAALPGNPTIPPPKKSRVKG